MVERGGLENRCASLAYRGFESLPLRWKVRGKRPFSGEITTEKEGSPGPALAIASVTRRHSGSVNGPFRSHAGPRAGPTGSLPATCSPTSCRTRETRTVFGRARSARRVHTGRFGPGSQPLSRRRCQGREKEKRVPLGHAPSPSGAPSGSGTFPESIRNSPSREGKTRSQPCSPARPRHQLQPRQRGLGGCGGGAADEGVDPR